MSRGEKQWPHLLSSHLCPMPSLPLGSSPVDAAVWAEFSLVEAIPAVFPHKFMGVRPVRGVLGDQGDANCPWPCVAIDLSKVQRAP